MLARGSAVNTTPKRKGIILAGGSGTRLHPATLAVSKQLLPVYDKPMVYYPLSTLMLAGMRDILLISTPQDTPRFEQLLGDGSAMGPEPALRRAAQPRRPGAGLPHRARLRRRRAQRLVLGDNIFYGHDLPVLLQRADAREHGAERVRLPRAPTPSATAW
jgi:glucose-1-phosphate thymidylyltransferase